MGVEYLGTLMVQKVITFYDSLIVSRSIEKILAKVGTIHGRTQKWILCSLKEIPKLSLMHIWRHNNVLVDCLDNQKVNLDKGVCVEKYGYPHHRWISSPPFRCHFRASCLVCVCNCLNGKMAPGKFKEHKSWVIPPPHGVLNTHDPPPSCAWALMEVVIIPSKAYGISSPRDIPTVLCFLSDLNDGLCLVSVLGTKMVLESSFVILLWWH